MAAWSALEPSTPEPKRVIMPWSEQWTDRWGLNRLPGIKHKMWRDQYGISEVIVEGIFPSRESVETFIIISPQITAAVVERDQWERLVEGDEWIHMERGEWTSSQDCGRLRISDLRRPLGIAGQQYRSQYMGTTVDAGLRAASQIQLSRAHAAETIGSLRLTPRHCAEPMPKDRIHRSSSIQEAILDTHANCLFAVVQRIRGRGVMYLPSCDLGRLDRDSAA
jgi:hypothetical protein